MKKKTLKVSPARKIYQPKYPSFDDKNPLLHPSTRPYPFNDRFIKWASTGGIASLLLLGHGEVLGQAQRDSLYNPFPLENAQVPYRPVSFGTGMPERMSTEVALQAIQAAFEKENITIEEDVFYENGKIKMKLDGFSHEDEIGFVLLSYKNMDRTFVKDGEQFYRNPSDNIHKVLSEHRISQKNHFNIHFDSFLKNKEDFIENYGKYKTRESQKIWLNKINEIDPLEKNRGLFVETYLDYYLNDQIEQIEKSSEFLIAFAQLITSREINPYDKQFFAKKVQYISRKKNGPSLTPSIQEKILAINDEKSDEALTKRILEVLSFIYYKNGAVEVTQSAEYIGKKQQVMEKYPVKDWWASRTELDEYNDKIAISLREFTKLDNNNKKGKSFIATISMRDDIMILPSHFLYAQPEELREEQRKLGEAYNKANGMTTDMYAKRKAELKEINQIHKLDRNMKRELRDSIHKVRRAVRQEINDKYTAMEKLNAEEKAEWKVKFRALSDKSNAFQKKKRELESQKKLQHLEDEVRMYIQWAKSQIGG